MAKINMMLKPAELAEVLGMHKNNIYNTYLKKGASEPKSEKLRMYTALDIGAYCLKHHISAEQLILYAEMHAMFEKRIKENIHKAMMGGLN
jgi:hypothetical protein